MSKLIRILFFGSTSDSVLVLNKIKSCQLISVVTQPPKPVGRHQELTPTPVEIWAKENHIPTNSFKNHPEKSWLFENETEVYQTLIKLKPDLLVSASFGQKIPTSLIKDTKYGGLNIHPSLLPRWRGADPVPWAILSGDKEIGVTIVTIEEKFDQGKIIAQDKIPINDNDTSDPLRTKLFEIGSDMLTRILPDYLIDKLKGTSQIITTKDPYAKRFRRSDGFEPWENIKKAMNGFSEDAVRIDQKFRALDPWPGVWTIIGKQGTGNRKRLIIRKCQVENGKLILDTVQLEGKKPVPFVEFTKYYQF